MAEDGRGWKRRQEGAVGSAPWAQSTWRNRWLMAVMGFWEAMKKERSSAALLLHCFFDVGGLEHFFGIYALFAQLLEFCYYLGTVLGIGYAEPLGGGVEDFAGGGAVLD